MLIKDTEREKEVALSYKQSNMTPDQRAKIFNSNMLTGDLCGTVRYLTEQDQRGILFPKTLMIKPVTQC